MSRRKVDYVYVPKKKIKKVVIDAKKGRKSVEKTVNQRQILDGAYVRASAMKEFPNGKFAKGGKMNYSKKDRVIYYYYENDVFDDYETYGLSEEDLNNENKVVKAIIEYHGLDNLENVNERFEILFGEGNDEYAKGGSTKRNLPMTDIFSPREKNVTGSKLLFDLQYGDVFKITAPNHQKSGRLFVFVDLVESKYMGARQIMIKAKPFPPKTNEEYVQIKDLKDGDITILSQEEAGSRLMRQQIEKQKFANGGITKNHISVGDIVLDKNDNKYYIVYEVKNDAATKRYFLPDEVAESVAAHINPELIDWNKYTMYSDQPFVEFSVGDLVYNSAARKSGVIIRKETALDGEFIYSVKYANNAVGHYINDYELELISTFKRGGNIGSYNTGRSWTLDHNQHNKSENYEIPMDDRKFAKGGTIKNQYAGKTARQVWEMWTPQQREHFLGDHYHVGEYRPESIAAMTKMTYDELRSKMATISGAAIYTLEDHIMRGQYKRGGNIGSYNTGRSWTLDHNQHNKQESYEIPMDDRKFAKGGKVGEEITVEFKYKNNNHKFSFTPEESDWWTSFKSKDLIFDLHYDEDYGTISVYEYSNKGTDYTNTVYSKKIMAKGGEIPDLTNMNIDHLFANGGRTYPITEEKIYM